DQPGRRKRRFEDLDEAAVSELADGELGDARQGVFVFQRGGQDRPNLGQKRLVVLDALLLGDVAQRYGEKPLAADFELRNGGVGRKLLAALAQAEDDGAVSAHAARALVIHLEAVDVLLMARPKALGQEQGKRRAEHLGLRVAKDLLGALVEDADVLL